MAKHWSARKYFGVVFGSMTVSSTTINAAVGGFVAIND